ncbi:hypothetical protein Tco_0360591 [Tanacetum coccineum]
MISLKSPNIIVDLERTKDFQDSLDDEDNTRRSQEYLNDFEEEYQERALLAKSKRFFKKGSQRFNSAKKPEPRPNKDFEEIYNKVKAKLALLSFGTSYKSSMAKNKGLVAKAYEWDEEDVSSNDNEILEVKILMALADDENVFVSNMIRVMVMRFGSIHAPPMLDRTDFESWQQRIRLYCLGKDNGVNIMKSITEGPFQIGNVSYKTSLLKDAKETEGALQLGPERARVFTNLSAEEKERFKADIRDTNILLLGMTGNHNYTMNLNASVKSKERPFMFTMLGSTSTDNLIESLTNTLALLRTSSNARNNATVQDDRVVVQDVRAWECWRSELRCNVNTGQAKLVLCFNLQRNQAHSTEECPNPKRPQVTNFDDDVFEADQCDAFDSDVDEAPTTQTMFMVNLSLKDPFYG